MTEAIELTVDGPHGPRDVRVTNPDRVYFPQVGITKYDVVRYFLSVGDGILEALRERPTTLERRPTHAGAGGAFYQKRLPKGAPPWVETVLIEYPNAADADMVCPTETAVIAWAANIGTLTFHPAPVRRPDLHRPDQLRVDLDPQPGTGFREAAHVATRLRELLAELEMVGFPKTTGGRGLHVIVPIEPRWPHDDAQRALVALGAELVRRMPRETTMRWAKKDRGETIFVDCNPATIASAYSIRPTSTNARVSAPLTWDELADAAPDDFTVDTMPARYAAVGDLHAGLDEHGVSIEPLLELAA